MAAIDPCSLLDESRLDAEFSDFAPFERKESSDHDSDGKVAGGRWCDWGTKAANASDPYLDVSVGVYDGFGIKDIPKTAGETETGSLASGRKAAQTRRPPEACFMSLAVGENSRIDVLVAGNAKACEMAATVADEIDPKIPKE